MSLLGFCSWIVLGSIAQFNQVAGGVEPKCGGVEPRHVLWKSNVLYTPHRLVSVGWYEFPSRTNEGICS